MATYIALLRGINVGQNILKMDRLRDLCSELRFQNVITYLQSGNVIFEAEGSAASCSQAFEQRLSGETRLPVSVIVRTPAELNEVIARNPFLKAKGIDTSRLHVTFLAGAGGKNALETLGAIKAGADQFRLADREVYLHCPGGYGNTKLSNSAIERALSVRATTRNWNTAAKLCEMALVEANERG